MPLMGMRLRLLAVVYPLLPRKWHSPALFLRLPQGGAETEKGAGKSDPLGGRKNSAGERTPRTPFQASAACAAAMRAVGTR